MAMAASDFIFSFVFIGSLSIRLMIGLIHRVSMDDGNMDSKCRRTLPGMRRKCRPSWRSGYLTRIDTNFCTTLGQATMSRWAYLAVGVPGKSQGPVAAPLPFQVNFPEMEETMVNPNPSPVTQWRKRRRRQGFVRVEVQVRKEDAALVREIASALVDSERDTETRAILREKIAAPHSGGLKALLASAPLEEIDLERPRDFGRNTTP